MPGCGARVVVGDLDVRCSMVEHDGQHLSIGFAGFVKQPTPPPLVTRTRAIAYRIAWSDDPAATLEV